MQPVRSASQILLVFLVSLVLAACTGLDTPTEATSDTQTETGDEGESDPSDSSSNTEVPDATESGDTGSDDGASESDNASSDGDEAPSEPSDEPTEGEGSSGGSSDEDGDWGNENDTDSDGIWPDEAMDCEDECYQRFEEIVEYECNGDPDCLAWAHEDLEWCVEQCFGDWGPDEPDGEWNNDCHQSCEEEAQPWAEACEQGSDPDACFEDLFDWLDGCLQDCGHQPVPPPNECFEMCDEDFQHWIDSCEGDVGFGEPTPPDEPTDEPADEDEGGDWDDEDDAPTPIEVDAETESDTWPDESCYEDAHEFHQECFESCYDDGETYPEPMSCSEQCAQFYDDIFWLCLEQGSDDESCHGLAQHGIEICLDDCNDEHTEWCESGDVLPLLEASGYGWHGMQEHYMACFDLGQSCLPAYELEVDVGSDADGAWHVSCQCVCPEHDIPPPDSCEDYTAGQAIVEGSPSDEDAGDFCAALLGECTDSHTMDIEVGLSESGHTEITCSCRCVEPTCPDLSGIVCDDGYEPSYFEDDNGCEMFDCLPVVSSSTFPCGDELSCQLDTEYCHTTWPGIVPEGEEAQPTRYCAEIPSFCAEVSTDELCACIQSLFDMAPGECSQEDNGGTYLTIYAP